MDLFNRPEDTMLILDRGRNLLGIICEQSPLADHYNPNKPWLLLSINGKTQSFEKQFEVLRAASATYPEAMIIQEALDLPVTRLVFEDTEPDSPYASTLFVGRTPWCSGSMQETETLPEFATGFHTIYGRPRDEAPHWFTQKDFLRDAEKKTHNPLLSAYRIDGLGENTLHTTHFVLAVDAVEAVRQSGVTERTGSYLVTPVEISSLYLIAKEQADEGEGRTLFCKSRNPQGLPKLDPDNPGGMYLGPLESGVVLFQGLATLSQHFKNQGFRSMPAVAAIRREENKRYSQTPTQAATNFQRPRG